MGRKAAAWELPGKDALSLIIAGDGKLMAIRVECYAHESTILGTGEIGASRDEVAHGTTELPLFIKGA